MTDWISDRTLAFDSSGIRKVFDLAATLKDPVNLSIGQPDFAVPDAVKKAHHDAVTENRNGYSLTQGIPQLREKLQTEIDERLGHADRKVFVTSGTSGGLVLTMQCFVNPGDEVIIFDPYFVMYQPLVQLAGGQPVLIDTAPDFKIDIAKVEAAISPRTKMILLNSPANPTGVTASAREVQQLAELASKHEILLVSDEIYSQFCYDAPFVSPAYIQRSDFGDRWILQESCHDRVAMSGFVHGPSERLVRNHDSSFSNTRLSVPRNPRNGRASPRWTSRFRHDALDGVLSQEA